MPETFPTTIYLSCTVIETHSIKWRYAQHMKNHQVTIRDLALKLNVSISTVSRALRDASDINPETKREILALASEMNYEPNRIAQSLRIKSTKTIGVIVPEIALYFFSTAISGIQAAANEHGYSIMICQSMESFEMEKANIHMLLANRVDGLMISLSGETDSYEHLQNVLNRDIPIILFDRICDLDNTSKVIIDDYTGALDAVTYLIETGCKNIAYLGGPSHLHIAKQREKGYRDALAKYDVSVHEKNVLHCNHMAEEADGLINLLLDSSNRPDAIFCFNDPLAIRAMVMLKERKIKIPEEISIIGFTDEPISALIDPSLTTVAQPTYEIGRKTFELFLNQINNPDHWEPETFVVPTQLIKRNSTR